MLHVNRFDDRNALIIVLVNAGYKVWLEEVRDLLETDYFVHYEEVNGDDTK